MTDNTASPYTVGLGWVNVQEGMTVELRHNDYQSISAVVQEISDGRAGMKVNGAWYYVSAGWSLWVKPEPSAPDPLIATIWAMYGMNHTTSMELTEVIRAAGYMTEAEWEAKRPQLSDARITAQMWDTFSNSYARLEIDLMVEFARAVIALAVTPQGSKP